MLQCSTPFRASGCCNPTLFSGSGFCNPTLLLGLRVLQPSTPFRGWGFATNSPFKAQGFATQHSFQGLGSCFLSTYSSLRSFFPTLKQKGDKKKGAKHRAPKSRPSLLDRPMCTAVFSVIHSVVIGPLHPLSLLLAGPLAQAVSSQSQLQPL